MEDFFFTKQCKCSEHGINVKAEQHNNSVSVAIIQLQKVYNPLQVIHFILKGKLHHIKTSLEEYC